MRSPTKKPGFYTGLSFVGRSLAVAYFPSQLPGQYRQRWSVSLPCSGWERVGPLRSNHQEPLPVYEALGSTVNQRAAFSRTEAATPLL